MAINISPKIITDGLVLCLDAKDIKSYAGSGTTWTDRSGNDNDGSIDGATFNSNGYFGLDGTNDKYFSIVDNIPEWNNVLPPLKKINNPQNEKLVLILKELIKKVEPLISNT